MNKSLSKLNIDDICERYKLSQEEHENIGKLINENMLYGKKSVSNPIAIIDIAPPGSGKTGLNGMGLSEFEDNNVVIINSDELKPYHPKIDLIAKYYPECYTKITNQESNAWTDDLFEKVVMSNLNVIFEGTGRNLRLLKTMIGKMNNYQIIVRGMAVNEQNCLMSILERYEGQVKEKGWGRLVTLSHFYKAYDEMLDTIEQIEKLKLADIIEVYVRGKSPSRPVKIYDSNNKGFDNARLAVIKGRENDKKLAKKYYETRFNKKEIEKTKLPAKIEILKKIDELYNQQIEN